MQDKGLEFVTARDQKLPILKILYANSKVLDESDGKYNEKAKQVIFIQKHLKHFGKVKTEY